MLTGTIRSATSAAETELFFDHLRAREFARLERSGEVYLDYTGSALYGESQIAFHHELLLSRVLGNPHAGNRPSRESTQIIEAARDRVLAFFDVDATTHDVCFTASTTAAVKLVAEAYPFGAGTPLIVSADNHNSVNGAREYARRAGADIHLLPLDPSLRLHDPVAMLERRGAGDGLLAFPAQSNFSGVRHPLSLVAQARSLGMRVLLDAAAYVPTSPLSLRSVPADYAVLSFYKIFGYPTGVGALIATHDALAVLRRPWFAGGTVRFASVQADSHRLVPGHAGFEEGTPDFLAIAGLQPGFELLGTIGRERLRAHVDHCTAAFLDGLESLRHGNGVRAVQIHGPMNLDERGGTVAFNLCDRRGSILPYWMVEEAAREAGVALRGGCFCNPGAAEVALCLQPENTSGCLDSLGDDFNPMRFASCLGRPVGALRASFGIPTNSRDIDRALEFLASCSN